MSITLYYYQFNPTKSLLLATNCRKIQTHIIKYLLDSKYASYVLIIFTCEPSIFIFLIKEKFKVRLFYSTTLLFDRNARYVTKIVVGIIAIGTSHLVICFGMYVF